MNSTKREGLNSGPPSQMRNLTQQQLSRGNSSGRKYVAPPSAHSHSNTFTNSANVKRTASANNPNQQQNSASTGIPHSSNFNANIGYSANHNKKFQSPLFNEFNSGFSQQQQTTNALSDFGSAISTSNGNMYGSSKR